MRVDDDLVYIKQDQDLGLTSNHSKEEQMYMQLDGNLKMEDPAIHLHVNMSGNH